MPLTITTGLSKKIGLPDYGSLGASCTVAFEAGHDLLESDLAGFHEKVKRAFVACRQAVQDELTRESNASSNGHASNGHTNGNAANGNGNGHVTNGNTTNGHAASMSDYGKRHVM